MIILKPSKIEGIGCFTTLPIRSGELVITGNDCRFVPNEDIEPDELWLYHWHAVERVGGFDAPLDFERMSVGWYLNHSETPNATSSDGMNFYASRDIQKDEEVLVDYSKLDDSKSNLVFL